MITNIKGVNVEILILNSNTLSLIAISLVDTFIDLEYILIFELVVPILIILEEITILLEVILFVIIVSAVKLYVYNSNSIST